MLGIRHYRKTAVDLWQGDSRFFVFDHLIQTSADFDEKWFEARVAISPAKCHVAISFATEPKIEVKEVMEHLRRLLDGRPEGYFRRMTFILGSLDLYWAFQEALFAVFPEEI